MMTTEEGCFSSSDGLKLFYRRWNSSQPARARLILVHGISEHSQRYENLAQHLVSRGFSVWAMDHRGHGLSQGRRCDCTSTQQFVDDLHQFLRHISVPSSIPDFLIGHSLGGLVSFLYALRAPQSVRGIALSSPAFALAQPPSRMKVFLVETLAKIAPTFPVPGGINPADLCRDPQVVEAYRRDSRIHRALTARCAVALRETLAQIPRLAPQLKVPCLLLQAGNDKVCDAKTAADFVQWAPKGLVTFHLYEGYSHELFNEPGKERVIEDLCRWLENFF